MQSTQVAKKKYKIQLLADSVITGEFDEKLNQSGKEFDEKFAKYDSILDARDKKIATIEGSVVEWKASNDKLKSATKKVVTVLKNYREDPVANKLDIDWSELDSLLDEKKSPDYPEISTDVPVSKKQSFFNRIFPSKKRK